jgi:hypothetical protein
MALQDYKDFSDIPNDYITKSSRDYDNERELYSVLGTEAINIWGTPITYYFTSFSTSADPKWGEDSNQRFTSAVEMQAMFTFPNRSRVYNQFGIISVETFNIFITMDHFDASTGGNGYTPYIGLTPKIGDVIRNNYRDTLGYAFYEISNVNQTDNQFEQGQFVWTITCKLYNDQHILVDTGLMTDPIATVTDIKNDIFDISSDVDTKKVSNIYTGGSLERPSNSQLLGGW